MRLGRVGDQDRRIEADDRPLEEAVRRQRRAEVDRRLAQRLGDVDVGHPAIGEHARETEIARRRVAKDAPQAPGAIVGEEARAVNVAVVEERVGAVLLPDIAPVDHRLFGERCPVVQLVGEDPVPPGHVAERGLELPDHAVGDQVDVLGLVEIRGLDGTRVLRDEEILARPHPGGEDQHGDRREATESAHGKRLHRIRAPDQKVRLTEPTNRRGFGVAQASTRRKLRPPYELVSGSIPE
jgi:hypothetical protein